MELTVYIPLMEKYLSSLKENIEEPESFIKVIEDYFNVLPPELLGEQVVDKVIEEREDKFWRELLIETIKYRLSIIQQALKLGIRHFLPENLWLLRFFEGE